jgi:hypothetical protein
MNPAETVPDPFHVMDCALLARATGRSVQNLRELRDGLLAVDPASIYHHFWGGLLRPRFDDPEFHNDFAVWARHALHDHVLAERLAVIDPTEYADLEELRGDLVDLCEDRLDEIESVPWAPRDQQFHFLGSQIVVFPAGRSVREPADLPDALVRFSRGSVYYHFIDARRRNEDGRDDLRAWLAGYGATHATLIDRLGDVDPLQGTLAELKEQVLAVVREFIGEVAR